MKVPIPDVLFLGGELTLHSGRYRRRPFQFQPFQFQFHQNENENEVESLMKQG